MLNLGKENEEALRSPGSLIFSPNIPQTIRDAIVLVRNVGLQYLWVDSLCVIQDDPEDMAGQLQQMGEVYQHSYFTIFAISGQDVNYGLPGVRWDSRRLKQTICEIGDLKIANCLPWMEEDELVQTGAWGSRAWVSFHTSQKLISTGPERSTEILSRWCTLSDPQSHIFYLSRQRI